MSAYLLISNISQNRGLFDSIEDMWDLIRIRRMLLLFRKCPHYNGPEWNKKNDTQEIEWFTFSGYLLIETYFIENWKYELLRRFFPLVYQNITSTQYKEICDKRHAKINRYIEKTIKHDLLEKTSNLPNSTKLNTKLKLTNNGIDFIDNPTDFLKIVLKDYSLVTSFLLGIIPPTILWLAKTIPSLLIEYGFIPI